MAKPIGPDIAKLRKKLNCSIAEARQLVERYGSADAYFRASAPAGEPRLAEPENRVEGMPRDKNETTQLLWRDATKDPPQESCYCAITTFTDPGRVYTAYYNKDEEEFDFMPPRAAIEWVIEPAIAAIVDAMKKSLSESAMKQVSAALDEINVWANEFIEEKVLNYLDSGYDTGANRDVATWCPLPEPGLSPGEEAGAEIVQLGAYEAAEMILPHIRSALAYVLRNRPSADKAAP